jgi:hypothetical protein
MGVDDRLSGLANAFQGVAPASGRLPPVERWDPPRCGDIDIRISRDGAWWHEGAPIARTALVRLFSTVLRRDPDGYWLVTPAEKLRTRVEDAPFVAVAVERAGEALRFTTNLGDTVEAGPERPLRVETDPATGAPAPYVLVRGGLEARLSRPVFYALAEEAEARGGRFGVVSHGVWFDLGPVEADA